MKRNYFGGTAIKLTNRYLSKIYLEKGWNSLEWVSHNITIRVQRKFLPDNNSCNLYKLHQGHEKYFRYFFFTRSPNSAQLTKDMLPTNDHNVDLHSSLSLQSECEENQHQIVNKQKVYFEGLPNFIVYREDTKVWRLFASVNIFVQLFFWFYLFVVEIAVNY